MKKNLQILAIVFGIFFVLLVLWFVFIWFIPETEDGSTLRIDGMEEIRESMKSDEECVGQGHVRGNRYSCVVEKGSVSTMDYQPLDRCDIFVECEQDGKQCVTLIDPRFSKCVECVESCLPEEDGCYDKCQEVKADEIIQTKFTLEQLALYNSKESCLLAIDGKVYGVTEFINNHPGGDQILSGCGKDATTLFETRPEGSGTPHSSSARAILEEYYIGDLE